MTFDEAATKADQEIELTRDPTGQLEYPIKWVKDQFYRIQNIPIGNLHGSKFDSRIVQFSSVHHLSLHFPSNFGADSTRIYYIGLKGEFSEAHYHGVTICSYESRPNMADHKNDVFDSVHHGVS